MVINFDKFTYRELTEYLYSKKVNEKAIFEILEMYDMYHLQRACDGINKKI